MPDIESTRIHAAAEIIQKESPTIIFIQEIRDEESCNLLSSAIGKDLFKVATCSNFKDHTGVLSFQQCAIITSAPVVESAVDRWHSFGLIEPPRGFVYALLNINDNLIACYCVHLKSNLMRKPIDLQLNILKRELAMTQLLAHIDKTKNRLKPKNVKFIVAGDFNTNQDDPIYLSESTIPSILSKSFENCFDGINSSERVTIPAKGSYADATFDYIFHKGLTRAKNGRVTQPSEISDHRMVVMSFVP